MEKKRASELVGKNASSGLQRKKRMATVLVTCFVPHTTL